MLRVACLAVGLALVAGCGQSAPTQLIVVVDTDYVIPSGLDSITIDVTGPDGMQHHEQQMLTNSSGLPLTLTLVPNGALGPVRIEAQGLHGGTWRVTRTADVTLIAGQTLTLPLYLLHACEGQTCGGDASRTCADDGTCGSVETPLLPWTGQPVRIGQDAGPAVTVDAGMDAATLPHDAGPAADAAVDAGSMPDAYVTDCRMTGCDDHQPCTDDACETDGSCTHTNNTVACDDHTFCNGMDTCGAGTCSVHSGNPCVAGTCDEPGGRCIGCSTDADCPAAMTGTWGACGNFADSCTTTGSQMRTVRTFHCASNACTPSDTTDTQGCSRTTEGTMCGTTSCGTFSTCGGFASTCATGGTQSRTCTDLACHSGACMPAMRTDTASCSRTTDGTSCMATSCGSFGACGGFASTCATGGTQSRTCTDYACGGGACNASAPRTDTASCSRTTDGTSCMTTSCGAWSACPAFGDTCSTSVSQTRTCTDYACSGGGCNGSPRTESQVCNTRTTDGTLCGTDPDLCENIRCLGGTCSNRQTTCSGSQHCCDGCRTGPCP